MFPGYVFLQQMEHSADLSAASYSRGVATLVRFGTTLATVPAILIRTLKQLCCPQTGLLQLDHPDIAPNFVHGQQVRLFDGPFAGLNGIFEARDGDQRAFILVELLGRNNRIMVEHHHLQAV